MPKQTYMIWRSGAVFKYRAGNAVRETPWNMQRERELQVLLARWEETRTAQEEDDANQSA